MRINAFGLINFILEMIFLLEEARHVLSQHQTHRSQVVDLLHDYINHHHHHHHHNHRHSQRTVSPFPASDGFTTAYLFQGNNRSIEVSKRVVQTVKTLFESSRTSFTIITAIQQETNNVGAILSLGTTHQRFLEIESSGWRRELRFHYADKWRTRIESFPFNMADNQWHTLALSVVGATHLNVYIDCKLMFERRISELILDETLNWDEAHIWIGQRNARHAYFKGAIEYVKLVTSSEGYLEQCPIANVACPTCSQFQQLQLSVQQLQSVITELTKQITNANQRILELEECECRKRCRIGEREYRDGETVPPQDKCSTRCKCKGGLVVCEKVKCPVPKCKNPVKLENDDCCQSCPKHCFANNKTHDHGEEYHPKPCKTCICNNGKFQCQRQTQCPQLLCPEETQVLLKGKCCKICPGTDFCSMSPSPCQANSTCQNLETDFVCNCNRGFRLVGKTCKDIDECESIGGRDGNHCHSNSQCVNTVGSYNCECDPGYEKVDQYSCREMNLCEHLGRNACDVHARCISGRGSYTCECNEGFEGDGRECKPICPISCQNGGVCVNAGVCRCQNGYRGRNCDTDIDECAEGIASCHSNSVCVNIPGSYYCECKDGFHSKRQRHNENGALCEDLDECQGWGGGQHCPASTVCKNTNGGYECLCGGNTTTCSPGCSFHGKYYRNGETWQPDGEACSSCQCKNGKVVCENKFNDCSRTEGVTSTPQQCCIDHHTCHHQELAVVYKTGDKWYYQCSICQCHEGETDCWPMDCPKLDCYPVVYDEDTCCPRCSHPNPCDATLLMTSSSEAGSCISIGQRVNNGHIWMLDSDNCSSCQCLNGNICCSYNQLCIDPTLTIGPRQTVGLPSQTVRPPSGHGARTLQPSEEHRRTTRPIRPRARTRHHERQAEDNG